MAALGIRDVADLMAAADDLAKETRERAATDKNYTGLAQKAARLAEQTREWGLVKLRDLTQNPAVIDDDPHQEEKHAVDPSVISRMGRGPGLGDLSEEWQKFMDSFMQIVPNDDAVQPHRRSVGDNLVSFSRQQDEFARQRQIGKDIATRFNPHYKRNQ